MTEKRTSDTNPGETNPGERGSTAFRVLTLIGGLAVFALVVWLLLQ